MRLNEQLFRTSSRQPRSLNEIRILCWSQMKDSDSRGCDVRPMIAPEWQAGSLGGAVEGSWRPVHLMGLFADTYAMTLFSSASCATELRLLP
jgi:hypothetical protein